MSFPTLNYLLISGSRTISSSAIFSEARAHLPCKIAHVYHGGARGVDMGLANMLIQEGGARQDVFTPDWKKFGRMAGKIRNIQMLSTFLTDTSPDIITPHFFAIWDGQSRGTAHMISQAAAAEGYQGHLWASWQVLLILPTGTRLVSSLSAAKLDPIISPCLQS